MRKKETAGVFPIDDRKVKTSPVVNPRVKIPKILAFTRKKSMTG